MKKEYFVVMKIANNNNEHLGTFWLGINGNIGEFPFDSYEKARNYAEWKIKEEEKNRCGHITELKILSREVTPWITEKEYIPKDEKRAKR